MGNEIFRYMSPCGVLTYRWNGNICSGMWLHDKPTALTDNNNPVIAWLDAYFDKKPYPLPPLATARTPFQARMRTALLAIPFGKTRTYGKLATTLNSAPRAIGQSLGANPLPLLIPCHRILAANGIGGFSCGLDWKRQLLKFEGVAEFATA